MKMLLGYCLITVALGLFPVVALGDAHSHRRALAFLAGQLGLKKAQAHQAELRQMLDAQQNRPGGSG